MPITADKKILLIREVSALPHLAHVYNFPGGAIDGGETPEQAANRELQEEIGYRAQKLSRLGIISPWKYVSFHHHLFLAEDLVISKLESDEPFSIETHAITLLEMKNLIDTNEITDATTLVAFHLLQDVFGTRSS